MIAVKGARNRDGQRSQDYVDMAIGIPDEYGNPFALIELVWKHGRNTEYAKSGGFEDTMIERKEGGGLSITYRPGSATWHKNLAGVYTSKVAKTPHNMKVLAAMYVDRLWDIRDPIIDAEVKALAETLEEGLSDEMKEFNRERREDMHRSPWDKADAISGMPQSADVDRKTLDMDRQEHAAKNRALDKREVELAAREKVLQGKSVAAAARGDLAVGYAEEALNAMHISKVKKLLRAEFDVDTLSPSMTKAEAVSMVLSLQRETASASVSPEADPVTS